MQENLETAKSEMQRVIDRILELGAVVLVDSGDGIDVRIVVDRFDILFARPVFGPDGAVADYYHWAVCFEVGFEVGGPQNVRLFKMKGLKEVHPGLICFTDHRDWKCFLESIDAIDEASKKDFRMWRGYKEKNKAAFERLYDELTSEMMEMALNWEKES
ncbi:MAG TPA: hypothetical protein PLI53_09115 [Geobacteraceae bacterium]|mgnify:CR=1 FL=1|nr:hypothetical protein [Geobacteraceae bacterium]